MNYNSSIDDKMTNFIKCDDNIILNINFIRWMEKTENCFKICTKMNGCDDISLQYICKKQSPESYNKLKKIFD